MAKRKKQKKVKSKEFTQADLHGAWTMSNQLALGHYGMKEAVELIRELVDSNFAAKQRILTLKESIKHVLLNS